MTDWQGNNPNINNPYLLISNYIKPPFHQKIDKRKGKKESFQWGKETILDKGEHYV